MLAPEGGEFDEECSQVEPAVRPYKALRLDGYEVLREAREHADDDLAVDRIRDANGFVDGDEAEVAHILGIVVVGVAAGVAPFEDRPDDPADAGLHEARDERVEVGRPGQDEPLLGLLQMGVGDRLGRQDGHLLHHLAGQGIHEPRLPAGQLEGPVERRLGEHLACLGGVLAVELAHLLAREVTKTEWFELDVEG